MMCLLAICVTASFTSATYVGVASGSYMDPGSVPLRIGESLESVKAASDIFAPMSGEIIEVNEDLNEEPGLINKSPYEKGWIAKIKISDSEEQTNLMTAEEYGKFLESVG